MLTHIGSLDAAELLSCTTSTSQTYSKAMKTIQKKSLSLSLWVSYTFFSRSALRGLGERQRLRESGAVVGG